MIRWLLAALHLLAFGIGFAAVLARGVALKGELTPDRLKRVFTADNFWALAAVLWLGTGVPRAFLGFEKGIEYYSHNAFFLTKLALFLVIMALEIRPIVVLMRWRIRARRGEGIDTSSAAALARISFLQAGLIVVMVLLATAMARGYGSY
jgi:putative membrane protein